jgi:hypothetical protein
MKAIISRSGTIRPGRPVTFGCDVSCWRAIALGDHPDRALEGVKALLHLLDFLVERIDPPSDASNRDARSRVQP